MYPVGSFPVLRSCLQWFLPRLPLPSGCVASCNSGLPHVQGLILVGLRGLAPFSRVSLVRHAVLPAST